MRPPETIAVDAPVFTPERVAAYGALTGDLNPIHLDPQFAARTQFGRPIVHGLCILLPAWGALESAFGPAAVAGMRSSLRFSAPVFVGTAPSYEMTLRSADAGLATYALSIRDGAGVEAVAGDVTLSWPGPWPGGARG